MDSDLNISLKSVTLATGSWEDLLAFALNTPTNLFDSVGRFRKEHCMGFPSQDSTGLATIG